MFFEQTYSVRLRAETFDRIDNIVKKMDEKFCGRAHFVRCAIIHFIKEQEQELVWAEEYIKQKKEMRSNDKNKYQYKQSSIPNKRTVHS